MIYVFFFSSHFHPSYLFFYSIPLNPILARLDDYKFGRYSLIALAFPSPLPMPKSLTTVLDLPHYLRSFPTLTRSRLMNYDDYGCLALFTSMVTLYSTLGVNLADTLVCMCGITLVELALACCLRAWKVCNCEMAIKLMGGILR
jgi:hypothetical protein